MQLAQHGQRGFLKGMTNMFKSKDEIDPNLPPYLKALEQFMRNDFNSSELDDALRNLKDETRFEMKAPLTNITVLGTSHLSNYIVQRSADVIDDLSPDTVVLQLCEQRLAVASRPYQKPTQEQIDFMIEHVKQTQGAAQALMISQLAKTDLLNGKEGTPKPNDEYRAPLESAKRCGARVLVADLPIETILQSMKSDKMHRPDPERVDHVYKHIRTASGRRVVAVVGLDMLPLLREKWDQEQAQQQEEIEKSKNIPLFTSRPKKVKPANK